MFFLMLSICAAASGYLGYLRQSKSPRGRTMKAAIVFLRLLYIAARCAGIVALVFVAVVISPFFPEPKRPS
jgi:hypothetical protein